MISQIPWKHGTIQLQLQDRYQRIFWVPFPKNFFSKSWSISTRYSPPAVCFLFFPSLQWNSGNSITIHFSGLPGQRRKTGCWFWQWVSHLGNSTGCTGNKMGNWSLWMATAAISTPVLVAVIFGRSFLTMKLLPPTTLLSVTTYSVVISFTSEIQTILDSAGVGVNTTGSGIC